MIVRSVRHRGLRRLLEDDTARFLPSELAGRVRRILTVLLVVEDINDLLANAPRGWRVHRLSGDRQGRMERIGLGQLANHVQGS